MEPTPICGNKEIADLLPWYVSKRLAEAEMVMVKQHLAACASCKEEADNITWISQGLYAIAGENGSIHINSRLLTIYSESKKELNKEIIQRIDDHLSLCRQCSEELEILNRVNQSIGGSKDEPFLEGMIQKIREFFTKPLLKPAYAYILILALLYPAWLGLFKKDNIQGKIMEPINISNLFILHQDDQRATGEQLNTIVLKNPADFFAFSFGLPVKNQEDKVYQATLSNNENKVVWHDENLKFIDSFGTVIMVCPQKYFVKGKYALTVIEKQKQSNEVLNKYFFNFSLLTKD
jgi:hypothetical protein